MNSNMYVSASPHLRSGISTTSIMRDVVIALLPSVVAGSIIFGVRALLIVALTVASCVRVYFKKGNEEKQHNR